MPNRRLVYIRISQAQGDKLERMRVRSGRRKIQDVIEVLIALADETAPEWNIIPILTSNTAPEDKVAK